MIQQRVPSNPQDRAKEFNLLPKNVLTKQKPNSSLLCEFLVPPVFGSNSLTLNFGLWLINSDLCIKSSNKYWVITVETCEYFREECNELPGLAENPQ